MCHVCKLSGSYAALASFTNKNSKAGAGCKIKKMDFSGMMFGKDVVA